jgi:preprotein translocase subunit YajC
MFINDAFAQAANGAAQAEPTLMSFLPLIGILVIFYFLLIRPQTKRAKEHKLMREALQKGDEIIIAGGELGRITGVGESYITMEIAPNLEITVLKASVQTLLPKGTINSIETGKSNRALKNTKQPKPNQQKTYESQQDETVESKDEADQAGAASETQQKQNSEKN